MSDLLDEVRLSISLFNYRKTSNSIRILASSPLCVNSKHVYLVSKDQGIICVSTLRVRIAVT